MGAVARGANGNAHLPVQAGEGVLLPVDAGLEGAHDALVGVAPHTESGTVVQAHGRLGIGAHADLVGAVALDTGRWSGAPRSRDPRLDDSPGVDGPLPSVALLRVALAAASESGQTPRTSFLGNRLLQFIRRHDGIGNMARGGDPGIRRVGEVQMALDAGDIAVRIPVRKHRLGSNGEVPDQGVRIRIGQAGPAVAHQTLGPAIRHFVGLERKADGP